MDKEQAQRIAKTITKEEIAELLVEHWQLKQCLCAQELGIPTGAVDWVKRSIRRGTHLRLCERYLEQTISLIRDAATDAEVHTLIKECDNCQGTKTVKTPDGEEKCVVCGGTGMRRH
jgi:hypothetical protein